MDPWNSGLNLITMLPPPFDGNASNKANKSKKGKFISKKIEKELISSKMKFKGNVAYYQKEKAISVYSKYVENI